MKKSYERKRLMKLYGFLYRRITGFEWDKCIYCNEGMECFDHVPPLSICEEIDVIEYKKNGGRFVLLPSCKKCNSYLYDYSDSDFVNRIDFLVRKYNKVLKRIQNTEWTKEELDELGYTLKTLIKSRIAKKEIIQNKITNLIKNLSNAEYINSNF